MSDTTAEIKETKSTYKQVNFLPKKLVRVVPIERRTFESQQMEQLPDGFIPQGISRSLELRRNDVNGEFVEIFDKITKVITPYFPEEPMTELEFFSRITGYDLSFTKKPSYWSGWIKQGPNDEGQKPYEVKLPKEGLILDLSNVWDCIAFKVLSTWKDRRIAPTWEDRNARPTYWFALVDEKYSVDRKQEAIRIKLKATEEFNKIKDHREALEDFLITKDPNNIISSSSTTEYLFNQVYDVLESNPELFLKIINDPSKDDKIFIYKAVKAGALRKTSRNQYEYFTGEKLGTMQDVITMINNPEKSEMRLRIQQEVDNKYPR